MNALTTTRNSSLSLTPGTMAEAMQLAEMLAASTLVPKDFQRNPSNIMVAIVWGSEIGLGALQALQGIAVVNGRPTIWGDAALALVRGHPACVSVREGVDGEGDARTGWCEVTRRGEEPQRRTFSVDDAKKAGLWGKAGPWTQYPQRMLQLRARGFALRDVFPDALRGVITTEEARDTPAEPRDVPASVVDRAPQPSRPTQAGGLLEHVQQQREPSLPIVAPDGAVKAVRQSSWLKAVERALTALDTYERVEQWSTAMREHQAAAPAEMWEQMMSAVVDRADALAAVESTGGTTHD
ncbi:hypothetical protein RGI145_22390 [Roseomonas gilardii]|uniref:RecT family n=1 Tax=Roseomonas gilardii TaxID=257708 RepID=A0A1L7AMM9_9PROT|nr:recombinase RecT [Roseomonas gilardii]APT60037.1 hypothetical protein RGI145_22390 [Roseomonas gilardii]